MIRDITTETADSRLPSVPGDTTRTAEPDLNLIGEHAVRWTVNDVASFLRVSVKTVYKWRLTGEGPIGARIGKHLRYDPADVVAWFDSQKQAA